MNAARDVIADGVVWVADGSITDVTPVGQTPPAHAASPVIATAGTIYPGMIELHNHLAYNAIPLFRIPRLYTKREEWQGTRGYRRYVSGPAGVIASVPDLIKATIRYVECKSLISGTTTSQGLTLRAAPIKHLYKGIVRNAEQPDAAALDPARPKIGDVTPDGRESFRKSLSGKGARIVHLAEGLSTSKAHDHFLDLQVPERHVGDRTEVRRHPFDGAQARGPGRHAAERRVDRAGRRSATSSSTAGRRTCSTAIDLGVKVALGSDWAPTASKNLLNELKVARIHSDDQQLGLTDLELVQMVTVNPARMLGWQGSLGSIESDQARGHHRRGGQDRRAIPPPRRRHRDRHPAGRHRRRRPLRDPGAPGQVEPGRRAGRGRGQHCGRSIWTRRIRTRCSGPLGLADATTTLADALEHMPERAAAIGSAFGVDPSSASMANRGRGGRRMRTPAGSSTSTSRRSPASTRRIYQGMAPALLDVVIGAESFASIAVPLKLDPLATEGDDTFFDMLANLANVPEAIRTKLPGRYGEVPRAPTIGVGPTDDDVLDRADAARRPARPGRATSRSADRRLIVEQAMVLARPGLRAPPDEARTVRGRPAPAAASASSTACRTSRTRDTMSARRATFHEELIEIFTSLRDLHTHYVPPEPYRSHTVYLPFLVEACTRDGASSTSSPRSRTGPTSIASFVEPASRSPTGTARRSSARSSATPNTRAAATSTPGWRAGSMR